MKTRVLFVITELNFGGAEIMLRNLLTRMDLSVFICEVISLQDVGPIGEQIQEMGFRVHSLGMKPSKPQLTTMIDLIKIIRDFRPDVINTWMYHADLMGSIASLFSGFPPVVWGLHHTVGDQEELKFSTRQIIRLNRWLSHFLPKRIICCAEATRRSHASIGFSKSKMVVITNGYDLNLYRPDEFARSNFREMYNIPPNTPVIGLFARYHPMKDHSTFIKAAGIIRQQVSDVIFVLAGSGILADNARLNTEIDEAGIRNNVLLLGIRKDIPSLLAAVDIYVSSSSRGEAFPMILGEAMACEVPCVVTDVGDSSLIVGDTGRVVSPGKPDKLASACIDVLTLPIDQRKAMGQAARERVDAEYNLVAIAEKYMQLFKDVSLLRKPDGHSIKT